MLWDWVGFNIEVKGLPLRLGDGRKDLAESTGVSTLTANYFPYVRRGDSNDDDRTTATYHTFDGNGIRCIDHRADYERKEKTDFGGVRLGGHVSWRDSSSCIA
jgi:hypothetical protein